MKAKVISILVKLVGFSVGIFIGFILFFWTIAVNIIYYIRKSH
jgi:hypothetical protein